jgi:hypothetical protein
MMAMNHVNCALMAVGKMIQESLFVTTAPTAPIQEGKDQLIPMNVDYVKLGSILLGKIWDMNLVSHVQMVTGRIKQEHHFVIHVAVVTTLGKKELSMAVNVDCVSLAVSTTRPVRSVNFAHCLNIKVKVVWTMSSWAVFYWEKYGT